jgi:hypothetical protein
MNKFHVLNVIDTKSQPRGAWTPRHKFYFPGKADIITDTSEVTTKAIVGDTESEERYTILSDPARVVRHIAYRCKHCGSIIGVSSYNRIS